MKKTLNAQNFHFYPTVGLLLSFLHKKYNNFITNLHFWNLWTCEAAQIPLAGRMFEPAALDNLDLYYIASTITTSACMSLYF